jgi:hypothetical protein
MLNGHLISKPGRQPGCAAALRHGDKLELGSITRAVVECSSPQQQQPPLPAKQPQQMEHAAQSISTAEVRQAAGIAVQQRPQLSEDACAATLLTPSQAELQQQQQQGDFQAPAWVLAAQQQQEQRHLRHQQQQQQHMHLPESRFSTWNSSPSQQHADAAAAGPQSSLQTHAAAGLDCSNSSSVSGGSIRGHRSSGSSSSSLLHTWGGSSSSPGGSSSSRQRAAAVPRLSAQGVLAAAAAAAAAGGSGGPTSPGGLLTPMILLRFPSCRLEGAVVKMVGADHRRNQSPCEDVVAWRTPLGDRQQVRQAACVLQQCL